MGKLAVQKATDERVKQFGQKMIDDHSKANEDLKAVASAQMIDIGVSLDSKHQATIEGSISSRAAPSTARMCARWWRIITGM